MNADVKKSLIIGLVAAEIASAIRAWRDLDRRHDDQIAASRRSGEPH